MATQATVGNLPHRRSGESRNPGNPPEKNGVATKRWRRQPTPPSFRRKPESRKSPGKERCGYQALETATYPTVVPAKAGIQEIPRKRTVWLPSVGDGNLPHRRSGESRNPGNPPEKNGVATKRWRRQPTPPSFRRKPESRKSPGKERCGYQALETATYPTVVPAKAGIQEIPRKRTVWLPSVGDGNLPHRRSGESRNPGNPPEKNGVATKRWRRQPTPPSFRRKPESRKSPGKERCGYQALETATYPTVVPAKAGIQEIPRKRTVWLPSVGDGNLPHRRSGESRNPGNPPEKNGVATKRWRRQPTPPSFRRKPESRKSPGKERCGYQALETATYPTVVPAKAGIQEIPRKRTVWLPSVGDGNLPHRRSGESRNPGNPPEKNGVATKRWRRQPTPPSFRRKPESRKSPGKERCGYQALETATYPTVVPAKAGIQEIPRKRTVWLPSVGDGNLPHRRSGESRNPGNPPEKNGVATKRWRRQPTPPSFRRKPESRKSPGKERCGYQALETATYPTVVPAKAGIQEIPRKRTVWLPSVGDGNLPHRRSGESRNPGNPPEKNGVATKRWRRQPTPPSFRRKPESRKSPGKERCGYQALETATYPTVVPAKAGIQEIPRKRTVWLPSVGDGNLPHRRSGESRNPGNPPEKNGVATKRWRRQPTPPSFRRKPESRKSPGKERCGYQALETDNVYLPSCQRNSPSQSSLVPSTVLTYWPFRN